MDGDNDEEQVFIELSEEWVEEVFDPYPLSGDRDFFVESVHYLALHDPIEVQFFKVFGNTVYIKYIFWEMGETLICRKFTKVSDRDLNKITNIVTPKMVGRRGRRNYKS